MSKQFISNLLICLNGLSFRTGLVSVSSVARLDRDTNPHEYSLIINAVDAGYPISETGTATLLVQVTDVNDKPPRLV